MKSEPCQSSRIAAHVNYFNVFISSQIPQITAGINTIRLAVILLLVCLLAGVSNAQQPQQTNIILELALDDLREWRGTAGSVATINIEVKNVYRPSESTKSINLITTRNLAEPNEEKQSIQAEPEKLYSLAENLNQWFDLTHTQGDSLYLKITNVSWPNDTGTILFKPNKENQDSALIRLTLDAVEYQITAKVTNGNKTTTILDLKQGFMENQTLTIPLKAPTLFGGIWKKLISSEGLLGAVIAVLVAVLIGVLKDKIKAVFNRLLDFLGKYLGGKLAERRFLKRYTDNLSFNHKYLKLIGFNTAGISRPLLEEVFVSLRITTNSLPVGSSEKDEGHDTSAISFTSAFKQYQYMVILGGPGAGKTTTLSYALLMFTQKKAEEKFGIRERLLPIYIPLRRLSNSNRSIIEDLSDKDTQILSAEILKEHPSNYFEKKLKKGQCLVLLDGLDEVIDEKTHRQVAERINSLVAAYPDNRFVVTCRNAGWKGLLSGEFKVLLAQDFNRDEIQRFVLGWHKAVITQSEYSRLQLDIPDKKKFEEAWETRKEQFVKPAIDIQSRRLIHAIDSNNRILAIAINPMLLSLISLVHFNRQYLPRGRTVLYSQCIELLIDSWDRTRDILSTGTKVTAIQKEAVLREIAFDFQVKGKGEDSRANLEQLIMEIAHKLGISMPAKELLEDIEMRSGLLVERSIGVFGFSHLTLQEYLVAKHIQLNQSNYGLLTANFDRQEWREVILLYTGLIDDATELIKGAASANSLERQILAGYCIGDAQHCDSTVSAEIVDRLLSELSKNTDRTNEIINVMSAIAEDFSNDAVSVEEKLSEKLINTSEQGDAPKSSRLNAISILGGARITHALKSLILLMHGPDDDIREKSINAIILFGNLALPKIEDHLNTYLRISDSLIVQPIIEALSGINTGHAARLLMRLYDLNDPDVDLRVSYKLSQMMTNTFVEAELLELDIIQLPQSLRRIQIDRNGWSYKSAKSGFWFVDTKLRSDILQIIRQTHVCIINQAQGKGLEAMPKELTWLRSISFKILFPAFLSYLRTFQTNLIDKYKFDFLKELGFDEIEDNKIHYLVNQINKSFTIPLDLALQNVNSSKTSDYSYKTTKGVKVIVLISNIYFTIFYIFVLFYVGEGIFSLIRLTSHKNFYYLRTDTKIYFIALLLSLLFYIGIILITKNKLKKGFLTEKFFSLLLFPIANFLKVLPYLTRQKPRIKLISFQLLVLCFSGAGIFTFFLVYDFVFSGGSWRPLEYYLQHYGIGVLFFVLSSLYWKYYVLSQNPVLQLMLMHPQGRKITKES